MKTPFADIYRVLKDTEVDINKYEKYMYEYNYDTFKLLWLRLIGTDKNGRPIEVQLC